MTSLGSSASELNFADVSDYSSSEKIENIREFIISYDIAASTSNLNNLDPIAIDFESGDFVLNKYFFDSDYKDQFLLYLH